MNGLDIKTNRDRPRNEKRNRNRNEKRNRNREQDAHLPLDELQPRIHVLFRLVLVLLHEHGPDELEDRVFRREGQEFLCTTDSLRK